LFQTFVSNVSSGCFKSRSWCYTCCKATHAYFKCFICFRLMLQMFYLDVSKVDRVLHMLQWLYTHILNACFKICFTSGCFESRSGVASCRWLAKNGLPQSFSSYHMLPRVVCLALSSSLPPLPFPSLHLAMAVRARPDLHTDEGWAMGVGQGSCMRRAQARELGTDAASRAG
jgi:hypothetical protein